MRLSEYVESGVTLDAKVASELITSVFLPTSVIHDGALVVSRDRLVAAGVILPLTADPNVSRALGTRHRAAIGITEATDAVALVVSEEEGSISYVVGGKIKRNVDGKQLRESLGLTFGTELVPEGTLA